MPKPTPVPLETRRKIAMLIECGEGRNELAREFGISAGIIEHHLFFAKTGVAVAATQARLVDQWTARIEKEEELLTIYFGLE